MNLDFWKQKWERNETGFHEATPNALLLRHFNELNLNKGDRVFIPLCGKTLDIAWLLSQGYRVAGAELSELAIAQLFLALGVKPDIETWGKGSCYRATHIDIFAGDIFDLSYERVGPVDAIYDRAALIALPADMRERYTKHLLKITEGARQLLITFEYDQRRMQGPPFSVNRDEVQRHYKAAYTLTLLESISLPDGLKGICAATENMWHLKTN